MTTMAVQAKKKIAIVVHQQHSRPGRVGALLEKRGYELHRLCPNFGCELPEDVSEYAGVVIFGGPMSANDCDTLDCIRNELDWIPKVVEARVPFLGLCLGAQLLTRTLGGKVAPHPEGRVEIGYTKVEPTEAGRAWFPSPMHVYEWHREGMVMPECCELLARTVKAAERLKMPGAHQRGVHLSMHALYDPPLDRWINGFLDRWLASDARAKN